MLVNQYLRQIGSKWEAKSGHAIGVINVYISNLFSQWSVKIFLSASWLISLEPLSEDFLACFVFASTCSFFLYLFIFLCFSFFLLQPVIFQTISSPSFPLLQLIQCSTFSTFWFPLNPSLFLILNVCLHILILISLSRALSLSSEMTKIHFLFAITKSSLPMFPPLCLLFGPSTVFIFVPVEQHCPQPSQPSFLLVVSFSNLPIN